MNIKNHKGWVGQFTNDQAKGAIPNGTRIKKTESEEGDATPDGTLGTVLGSLRAPPEMGMLLFYFVEWDNSKRVAVGIMGWKIALTGLEPATPGSTN